MRCVAMVVRGKHVTPCDLPCTGKYCTQHIDRDSVKQDADARKEEIAQRILAAQPAAARLPPETFRPRRKLHPRLQWIVDQMEDNNFYGREAHELTLSYIEAESRAVTLDLLHRRIDPFDVPAFQKDAEHLALRSLGKMSATRLKMAERERAKGRVDKEDALAVELGHRQDTADNKARRDGRRVAKRISLEDIRKAL